MRKVEEKGGTARAARRPPSPPLCGKCRGVLHSSSRADGPWDVRELVCGFCGDATEYARVRREWP